MFIPFTECMAVQSFCMAIGQNLCPLVYMLQHQRRKERLIHMKNTLIEQAQNGDGEALITLIESMKQEMFRIAFGILKSSTDAADAIQDTALTCCEKIDTLKNPAVFKSWMFKILVNHCRRILRERRKMISIQELQEQDSYAGPEKEVTDNIEFFRLMDQIEAKYRLVLLLYYAEQFSVKEIAELLELNENTIKTRLSRGRNLYKKLYLKEHSYTESRYREV